MNFFFEALGSHNPSPELGKNADIYNWLVGSWSVKVIDYAQEGKPVEQQGEWHFSWALEGRAIQDIFIVPKRDQRQRNMSKQQNRYGTTIRFYDPSIDAWRISWTNPVGPVQNHLIARKIGNDIIQDGVNDEGMLVMRWSFRDIKRDSFRWVGEESTDNGKTWLLRAEFFATRD